MAIEQSPAFQFYVKEWRSSRAILRMTFAQRGMYLEMLLEQWESETLPDDPAAVAQIIGGTTAEWTRAWPILRRKFVLIAPNHLQNMRLEKERAKQRGSARGGKNRAISGNRNENGTFTPADHPGDSPADVPAVSPGDEPETSSVAFPTPIPTSIALAFPTPDTVPRLAGKQRPILKLSRFSVFRWMVEQLIADVGSDFEDMERWFFELNDRAEKAAVVIDDSWTFIRTQTLAEAKRRGLGVVLAEPTAGKLSTRMSDMIAKIAQEG